MNVPPPALLRRIGSRRVNIMTRAVHSERVTEWGEGGLEAESFGFSEVRNLTSEGGGRVSQLQRNINEVSY